MQQTLVILGIMFAALALGCLIASVAMFFGFHIPELWKDRSGVLEQKQIEEIRYKNTNEARQKGKINVFEDLEKRAKLRKGNTQGSFTMQTEKKKESKASDGGTSLLNKAQYTFNPNFVIEKDITFVSTDEVM